ncbi:ATP-dependent RNA helicase MAK5 [Ceratocystis platani]|uniref:RNA helicase n=1 Tax=Ceratocystis fimbriata f. sp. platani TaxID=88771 RepID=A0A0F8DAX4_CERFI|nr:ATP-dependent RNA helicase MAK5 [Ceratocystis platani]
MAQKPQNKRKLPAASQPAARKRSKTAAKVQKPTKSARVTDVNDLPWQNDIDEFLDLQVVENVEVVREGDRVKFVVRDADPKKKKKTSAATTTTDEGEEKNEEGADVEEANSDTGADKDEDEFEGFDEDSQDDEDDVEPEQPKPKTEKSSSKKDKPSKKTKNKPATPAQEDLSASAFSVLENMDNMTEELDMSEWASLNLCPEVIGALERLKFTQPTTIQVQSIPEILAGHDVIGKAATGTGKTLAFGLPIIEKWLEKHDSSEHGDDSGDNPMANETAQGQKVPLALILSPTRELARQISTHLQNVCHGLPKAPYVCSVTGGLAQVKQLRQLAKADIVVGTPGRLWELLSDGGPLLHAFKRIQFLVIDEADRLLADGSFEEASSILEALDRRELVAGVAEHEDDGGAEVFRQTLVFSATLNKALHQKLGGKGKKAMTSEEQSMEYLAQRLRFREEDPVLIDVSPASHLASGLQEGLLQCGDAVQKDLFLYSAIALLPPRRTLVFTNAIKAVRRLVPFLQQLGFQAKGLHSQMLQKARLQAIEWVKAGGKETRILVATDVAARGLDIPSMDQVIHYHVPRTADTYVHRSGRTARAQQTGTSILICTPDEATATRRLIGKIHSAKNKKRDALDEMQTVQIDPKALGKYKPRVELAKKLADAYSAKERSSKQENWLKTAAEELGVEYDSEELSEAERKTGKGSGRREREKQLSLISKGELATLRAQLRDLLALDKGGGRNRGYVPGQAKREEEQAVWWV